MVSNIFGATTATPPTRPTWPSDGIGNPDLRWETTYTANLGIDFQFFNGRLGGTIDMYLSNTHDLLMSRTVPIMNGYSKILYNVGQTRNKGIELTLHSQNIRKKDFRWETDFTFSLNRDQIVALRGDGKDDINNKWFIGQPLSVYYDWNMIGIWQEGDEFTFIDKDGKEVAHQTGATPGAAKLEDVDGNGVIDSKDRKVIGSKQPSFTMSMGNRFSYKDLYFSFLFNGVFGKWMTDNVANISSYTFGSGNYIHGVKYWTPETPDAEVVSPGYQASFSHGYYKKLNYVQLRNITAGLPCQPEIRPPDRLERHRREFQREQRLRLLQHAPDAELRQHLVRIVPDRPFLRTGINLNLLIKT